MPRTKEAQKLYLEAKRNETPPEGQLCENGCNSLAGFHLMRSIKTETGTIIRWFWCCSNHYRKCPAKLKKAEEARTATSLAKYGVAHHMQLAETIEKRDKTSVKLFGVSHAMKLPEVIERKHQTEIKNNGDLGQSYRTRSAALMDTHGVENISQVPGVAEKIQESILQRFGGYFSSNEEWKRQYKEVTGYEHPRQRPEVEAQRALTCIQRYGVKYPLQIGVFRQKARATFLRKYGAPHPMQSPAFYFAKLRNGYKWKPFTYPSGRVINTQGYESLIIQELLDSGVQEEDIYVGLECPNFEYSFEGKERRYYPDIYVKSQNLIIEVKSTYTYQRNYELNQAKKASIKSAGYEFQFRVKHPNRLQETTLIN